MTNDEAIRILKSKRITSEDKEAFDMAIEALKQPCENCKKVREAYINGFDYGVKDWFTAKTQPCDAVSRDMVMRVVKSPRNQNQMVAMIEGLPSARPKIKMCKYSDYECRECGYCSDRNG